MNRATSQWLSEASVLVLNPGSSGLKWAWFKSALAKQTEISGEVSFDQLGELLRRLAAERKTSIAMVRFVHGGSEFFTPILVTPDIINKLEKLDKLAPLHNPNSVYCVQMISNILRPDMGSVAVFDTEFFQHLPRESQSYAIPKNLVEKYAIRRYGFHGFAHSAMLKLAPELMPGLTKDCFSKDRPFRLITLQLGSGCSMTAIKNSRAIDTSMGFTPCEGLLMATRSGDIDPGLVSWLQRKENWSATETEQVLNLQSGLLGLSGESGDMKKLLASDTEAAEKAVELFCYRIRKYLGAYYAILGGLDGVILSGGIAENSIGLCQRILFELEHLGIAVSSRVRSKSSAIELSDPESKVSCWVVENGEFQAMLSSLITNPNIFNLTEGSNHVSNH